MAQEDQSLVRRWGSNLIGGLFAIALALLFVLVLRSVAVQITPPPQYLEEPYPDVGTPERCEAEGGRWITQPQEQFAAMPPGERFLAYCQGPLKFERERMMQEERSRQTSLFVFAVGGALAVVVGLLIRTRQAVAPGLLLAGIASFFIAGVHVWQMSAGLARLITIVLIFLILLGVGLYVFRERPEAVREH
jgi:hypothetical protein